MRMVENVVGRTSATDLKNADTQNSDTQNPNVQNSDTGIGAARCVTLPISELDLHSLRAGDYVYVSGVMYTARDAAHKRLHEAIEKGLPLPLPIKGQTIYYMGPSPAPEGAVIGSAGPTTAGRMDRYTPELLEAGLAVMIGKGRRSEEVCSTMRRFPSVYLATIGGAGALLSKCIIRSEVIAYEDLGTEAIRRIEVENFPAVVVIDTEGNDLYAEVEKIGMM